MKPVIEVNGVRSSWPSAATTVVSRSILLPPVGHVTERPDPPRRIGRRDTKLVGVAGGRILELDGAGVGAKLLDSGREGVRLVRPVGELEQAVHEHILEPEPQLSCGATEGPAREQDLPVGVHEQDAVGRLVEQRQQGVGLGRRAHVRILSPTWPS